MRLSRTPPHGITRVLHSRWLTLGILIVAILLPALSVVWLAGRASDNERAAFMQVSLDLKQREAVLVREQVLQTLRDWMAGILAGPQAPNPSLDSLGSWITLQGLSNAPSHSFAPGDGQAEGMLEDLRYLHQTLGAVAAQDQLRYWLQEDQLQGLRLSGDRDFTLAVLLWAWELVPSSEWESVLLQYWRRNPATSVSMVAQRWYVAQQLREQTPEDSLWNALAQREGAILEFAQSGPTHIEALRVPGQLAVSDRWVCCRVESTEEGQTWVWFCSIVDFERALRDTGALASGLQGNGFDLINPGFWVTDVDAKAITVDLGAPFEGWRLHSRLQEDAWLGSGNPRIVRYVWVAVLTTVVSALFAFIGIGMVKNEIAVAALKNDLAATVSHELKTPVASVRILVDTLLEGKDPLEPKTREYLELIRRENHRLGMLVEKFLTFSRMERAQTLFQIEPMDANALVEEAVAIFRERFPPESFALHLQPSAEPARVRVDRQAMLAAIGNLLENAYKYSHSPRRIDLRVHRLLSEVWIDVKDWGEGIAAAEQKVVFRKFYQPDRRLSKHRGGVGLGLSIVAHVVHKHRARIELESEVGRGTRFRIILTHANDIDH